MLEDVNDSDNDDNHSFSSLKVGSVFVWLVDHPTLSSVNCLFQDPEDESHLRHDYDAVTDKDDSDSPSDDDDEAQLQLLLKKVLHVNTVC